MSFTRAITSMSLRSTLAPIEMVWLALSKLVSAMTPWHSGFLMPASVSTSGLRASATSTTGGIVNSAFAMRAARSCRSSSSTTR